MGTKTDNIKLPPMFLPGARGYDPDEIRAYARAAAEPYAKALRDLIEDLELRSNLKRGRDHGIVDCGQGVYMRAKRALGEWDE